MSNKKRNLFNIRAKRIRYKLKLYSGSKVRLTVFRSNKNIYAQAIDDRNGVTLAAASTLEKDLISEKSRCNTEMAKSIGKLIAQRLLAKEVAEVIFDRGGYLYHGKIKALADAARQEGLKF